MNDSKHKLYGDQERSSFLFDDGDAEQQHVKRARSERRNTLSSTLACHALNIVLQHWLVPDLGWSMDKFEARLPCLCNKIARSIVEDMQTNNASGITIDDEVQKKEISNRLKIKWTDTWNISMAKDSSQAFRAENISERVTRLPSGVIVPDINSVEEHRFTAQDCVDSFHRLYNKHWINVSFRLEYFSINSLHDLREAYLNLHATFCGLIEKQQSQYHHLSALIVYQLVMFQEWKDTVQCVIERALLGFQFITEVLLEERHHFVAYADVRYNKWSSNDFRANLQQYNISFCAFYDELRHRFEMIQSLLNVPQLYTDMMDAINGITFQLQSLPGQFNAMSAMKLTSRETWLRKLTSNQLNIQRLSSRDVFDKCLESCCRFAEELFCQMFHTPTISDMESIFSIPMSTNKEGNQQLKVLKRQLKEVRQFIMKYCLSGVLFSSHLDSITYKIGNKTIVQSPLFDHVAGIYGLINDCSRAQYSMIEEKIDRYQRNLRENHTLLGTMSLAEEEVFQSWELWLNRIMQYGLQVFSALRLLLNNNHSNEYYKMLLCRKIHFIETLTRSLSDYSQALIQKLHNNMTDAERNENIKEVKYYEDTMKVSYAAIQCVDDLIVMNRSGFVIEPNYLLITQPYLCRMFLFYGNNNSIDGKLLETHQLEHKVLLMGTYHQLLASRRDEEEKLQEPIMSEVTLSILQQLISKSIELEKEVFVLKSTITNDHQREGVLFREGAIFTYIVLIKYMRICINIIYEATSELMHQGMTFRIYDHALNYELSSLLSRVHESLESMKQFEGNMSQETDREVWTFRKRVANVVFNALVLEIVSLSSNTFLKKLRKIDEARAIARTECKTAVDRAKAVETAIEKSIDRDDDGEHEAFVAVALPLINTPLSSRLISRSSSDTVSASEGIRKWEVLSENAYWKGQVLKKNLVLMKIRAVLKIRYGISKEDDHDSNGSKEEETDEDDQNPQHESKYQQYREEYERCASSLQFIDDQWLLIPQHERNLPAQIEFDEFLVSCNEIVEDQERIDIYKKLSSEEMHASVEKAFVELSMYICNWEG